MQLSPASADPDNPEYQALAGLMQAAGLETTSLNLLRAAAPTPEAAFTLIKWMIEGNGGSRIADSGSQGREAEIQAPSLPSGLPASDIPGLPISENSGFPPSDKPQSPIRNLQFLRLAAAVDESGYALGAWVSALLAAHAWLADRDLRASFEDVLEYLRCCAAASGGNNVPLTDLPSIVTEMLDTYGLDAARPL